MSLKSLRKSSAVLSVRTFECQRDWARWLQENHGKSPGVWLRLAKKDPAFESVSYGEAFETRLCFGWIDKKRPTGSNIGSKNLPSVPTGAFGRKSTKRRSW